MNTVPKSIVIVSHSSDLGIALASKLIKYGWGVVLPVAGQLQFDRAKEALGSNALPMIADINEAQTHVAAMRVAEANFGNCIGMCYLVPKLTKLVEGKRWVDIEWDQFVRMFSLLRPFLLSHQVVVDWFEKKNTPYWSIIDITFEDSSMDELINSLFVKTVESLNRLISESCKSKGAAIHLISVSGDVVLTNGDSGDLGVDIGVLANTINYILDQGGRFINFDKLRIGSGLTHYQRFSDKQHLSMSSKREIASLPPIGGANLWRTLGKLWGQLKIKTKE